MSNIDNIKNLVSEGKTKEAFEAFQELLEGSGREELNQSLLLKSQYFDVLKKSQLGLGDANVDLSRINFALLNLCDQLENVEIKPRRNNKTVDENNNSDKKTYTAIIIFSIFVIVLLVIIFFAIKNLG
jgi:hypothetical protein